MSRQNRQPNDDQSELRRVFLPAEPRGYLSVDILVLYMAFVLTHSAVAFVSGGIDPSLMQHPVSAVASSLGVVLQGAVVWFICHRYITDYAGDDMGWWSPSVLQQEAPRASLVEKMTWVMWGGIGAWILATAGVRALLVAGEGILEVDPWEVGLMGQMVQSAYRSGAYLPLGLLLLGILVAAPLGEELLFRRSFYVIIIEGLGGTTLAVLGSGLIFAFTHGEPVAMLRAALAGIIYALAYHRTRAAAIPVMMHVLFNLLATLTVIFEFSPWLMP